MDKNALTRLVENSELRSDAIAAPSFIVRDVEADEDFALWPDVLYYPACMIKVPLAIAYFDLFRAGVLDPGQKIRVASNHLTETLPPAPYKLGDEDTILKFIYYSLRHSDNVATNVLIDFVDRDMLCEVVHRLGMPNTYVRKTLSGNTIIPDPRATGKNMQTPRDCFTAFNLIASSAVHGASTMRDYMLYEKPEHMHVFGLEPSDRIMFKNGYTSQVSHMGGMIEIDGRHPFIFTLFTPTNVILNAEGRLIAFMKGLRAILSGASATVGAAK